MNRVCTRSGREAGSACALSKYDDLGAAEFRQVVQKNHLVNHKFAERAVSFPPQSAGSEEAQDDRERENPSPVSARDIEALVLEPPADVAKVGLGPDAPGEIGAPVREGEEAAGWQRPGRVRVSAQLPARHPG